MLAAHVGSTKFRRRGNGGHGRACTELHYRTMDTFVWHVRSSSFSRALCFDSRHSSLPAGRLVRDHPRRGSPLTIDPFFCRMLPIQATSSGRWGERSTNSRAYQFETANSWVLEHADFMLRAFGRCSSRTDPAVVPTNLTVTLVLDWGPSIPCEPTISTSVVFPPRAPARAIASARRSSACSG